MSLLLLCICQGPSSVFQSSGSYQHMKCGVLNHHESSACSLWTPALSGIQKGLGSWEVHSQSSIRMPPLPVSPHDPVLLYASTHSAASVPVLSSCSGLSSCCQFCSPHWTGLIPLQGSRLIPPCPELSQVLCKQWEWALLNGLAVRHVCFSNRCQNGFLESSKLRFSTLNI